MVNLRTFFSFFSSSGSSEKSETTTNIFLKQEEKAKKIKLIVAPKKGEKNLLEYIHIYFSNQRNFCYVLRRIKTAKEELFFTPMQ